MTTTETHTIDERLDAIDQVEEFVNAVHNVGDAIQLNIDGEVVSYTVKYINSFRRAVSWIKSTKNWEGYTNSNVVRDIKHLIMDADSFNITLEFNGKESVAND